jgi:hypothetical protein
VSGAAPERGHAQALLEALRRPEAYAPPPEAPVRVLQTHISMLFFVGDRVYKVKKPVRLGFLDYSTVAAREHFCAEEVRLNADLAPGVYLGVVPIVRDDGGAIRVGTHGRARDGRPTTVIDYAVEMVRLPEHGMLDARLDAGEIDEAAIERIAAIIAAFHARCTTGAGVNEHAAPEEIRRQVEANLDDMAPPIFPRAVVARLRTGARSFLDANGDLLRRRVREGRIREGHGDLHAGNICFTAGDVVVYDRIEFSRPFRCRDVAGEIAFLAMDLDLRCFRGFGRSLVHRYAELTRDPDLVRLVDFYKSHWAAVRAKVAALRAEAPGVEGAAREDARREALRYLALAASYGLPPALLLTSGLPGTGKSRAARAAARPFEAVILRSDVVRKELASIAPTARASAAAGADVYAPEFTRRTYDALLARAREHLHRGRTVIVDATFPSSALRRPFLALAEERGATLLVLELRCPDELVRRRLARRRHDPQEVSDADVRVYEDARARFEPPREVPLAQVLLVDGDFVDEEVAAAIVERLCGGEGGGVQ